MTESRRLRVLVTNDDGIDSAGLSALAAGIQAAGHDTVVVAPEDDRSGSSASLGRIVPEDRIKVSPVEMVSGGVAVDACSILHSGTVGAVLTAQNFGASGLAVSLAEEDRWYTETATQLAIEVLAWLAEAP